MCCVFLKKEKKNFERELNLTHNLKPPLYPMPGKFKKSEKVTRM